MENNVTAEARQRAERSEAILRGQGVPINTWLPVTETEEEAKLRTRDEVCYRALSLIVVAINADRLDPAFAERLVHYYGLEPYLTPKERAFLKAELPSDQDLAIFLWRVEAAWVLLWALGYVQELEKPQTVCEVGQAVAFIKQRNAAQFIADARLRPLAEILDEADLIYRYHWAVVDARVNGRDIPAGLDPGVTY